MIYFTGEMLFLLVQSFLFHFQDRNSCANYSFAFLPYSNIVPIASIGDTHFNRSLRHFAKKAGLTLSDGGLSACIRRKTAQGWKRVQTDPSVRCQTEEDVFKALGLNYVEPIFRACHRLDKMKIRGGNRTWDNLIDMDESDLDDSDDEM